MSQRATEPFAVQLHTVDYGDGRPTEALLCADCAAHAPEEYRVAPTGSDPHGGVCEVCEREDHCDEGGCHLHCGCGVGG